MRFFWLFISFLTTCLCYWTSVGNLTFNDRIYDLAMNGSKDLYFGGFFEDSASGFNGIGKWDGNQFHTLSNGTNGDTWVLSIHPQTKLLWIGGNQTKCGSVDVVSLCLWDGNSFFASPATLGSGMVSFSKQNLFFLFSLFFFFFGLRKIAFPLTNRNEK